MTHLSLEGTNVTDNGLKHLLGLSKLREINIKGTAVTEGGVQYLRESFPGAKVGL